MIISHERDEKKPLAYLETTARALAHLFCPRLALCILSFSLSFLSLSLSLSRALLFSSLWSFSEHGVLYVDYREKEIESKRKKERERERERERVLYKRGLPPCKSESRIIDCVSLLRGWIVGQRSLRSNCQDFFAILEDARDASSGRFHCGKRNIFSFISKFFVTCFTCTIKCIFQILKFICRVLYFLLNLVIS